MAMKIVVTGASGTIGRRTVALLLKAGHGATALVRSTEARARLESAGMALPFAPGDAARAVVAAVGCNGGVFNVCEAPVLRSDWAAAIGQAAIHRDAAGTAKFLPALLQRLAGPRAEPLRRSHRVSNRASFRPVVGLANSTACAAAGRISHDHKIVRPRRPRAISERRLIRRGTA